MRWLATFCFFLSGASGLVFETVWTRQLGLIFGSTTLAIATVLSVFMGGLAVGSAIAGRYADRLRRPLLVYALAELGVGAYGLAIPLFLRSYPALNTVMWRLVGDHPVELSLLRFAATALLLLVPTALMGATLPLLSRHLVARAADYGRIGIRIGELYAANTLGAVAGTFVSGFVLLPMVGVQATNRAASFANIGLAVVIGGAQLAALASAARRRGAALLAKVRLGHAAEAPDGLDVSASDAAESEALRALPGDHAAPVPSLDDVPDADDAPPITIDGRARRVALVAFAFSGAAAMVYQVLWSRALAIVIGSSVYSFTIILLAFLIGLSIGAALWSRLANRSGNPVAWLAATHLGVVAMVIASYLLLDKLPGFFVLLLQGAAFSTDGILFTQFLLAALAVLPATVFLGGVMPLTIRIYSAGIERVGHDVGQAYSVNTVGAIVGSFAAGFVVLPRLGLQRGLFIAALVSTCVASALVLVARGRRRVRWPIAVVAPLSVAAMMAFVPRWDLGHFQAGLFRISIAKEIVASGRWLVPELLYYHDGISTTVSVERWGKHIALKNNGKVDASNGDDMPTQIMVGLMPFLFHPTALTKPPRAAVIGYGSGVTIGAVTQFPIGHADVVELEPEVVRGARWFAGREGGFPNVNHDPESNPRVTVISGDGRNFLTQSRGADDLYDVIISEPSNPWITGVSNLFTQDYWRLARARLADDGVFCQWAQLYEMSPGNIKTILRTFASVFPYTYIFSAEDLSSDVILIAANHPLPLDRARLQRNFADPTLRAELHRGDIESADDILANLLLTPDEIPAFTAGADLNTDDNARIEFGAPRDLVDYVRYEKYLARVYGANWPYGRFERYLTGLGDGEARGQAEAHLALSLLAHGKPAAADRLIQRAIADGGGALAERARRLGGLLAFALPSAPDVPIASDEDPLDPPRLPAALPQRDLDELALDYATAEDELRHQRYAHALKALGHWPEKTVDDAGKDVSLLIGYCLYKADFLDDAIDRLRPLADDALYRQRRPAALYYLARSLYAEALYEAGAREMGRYLDTLDANARSSLVGPPTRR